MNWGPFFRSRLIAPRSKVRVVAEKLGGRLGLRTRSNVPVQIGGRCVFLGADSWADWLVLNEIITGEYEDADFANATVVDVGAHKGYFAAYAFARGATRVISYEPAPKNLSALRTSASGDPNWEVIGAAVAPHVGVVSLSLDHSWTHTTHRDRFPAAQIVEVPAVLLEDVLARAAGEATRVVVKIDIEGAEGDVIRATPRDAWEAVDEVLVEVHRWACEPDDLIPALEEAGLVAGAVDDAEHVLIHLTRPAPTRTSR